MKQSIAQLTQLPGVWRGGELAHVVHPVARTGHGMLDRELPGGGWPLAALSEVLHDGVGIGEVGFLSGALVRAAGNERLVAFVNPTHLPYAPALDQAGIALERVLVVRPANRDDALWAAEQAMRSGTCGAVLFWSAPGSEGKARGGDDYAWLRRLQMAAEAGRSMAVLYRPTAAERLSTPAHLRVVLAREGGLLRLRIPKRRGPPLSTPLALEAGWRARAAAMAPSHPASASVVVHADFSRAVPRVAA